MFLATRLAATFRQVIETPAKLLVKYTGRGTGQLLDAGGDPASDEEAVKIWKGSASGRDAEQVTSGLRPVADLDPVPGLATLKAVDDQHLVISSPGGAVRTVVVIMRLENAEATLLSRDTDASTDKPAFRLRTVPDIDELLIDTSDKLLIDTGDTLLLG